MKIIGIAVVLAGLILSQLYYRKTNNGRRKWINWFSMPRV
jgi:hypothetical protein